MKSRAAWLRIAVTLAALFATLSYLYLQGTALYRAQHQMIVQELDEMRREDAELARDALRVRTGLLRQYDPLNSGLERLAAGLERLRREGQRGAFGEAQPQIEEHLARLSGILAECEERMEQFKSATALLTNSLQYLGVLQRELSVAADPAWQIELAALVSTLLRHAQAPEKDTAADLESRLQRMSAGAMAPGLRDGAGVLGSHARIALRNGARAEAALSGFLAAPPGAELRALETAYLRYYSGVQQRADLYRALLYGVSLLLLAYLAYLMIRLNATARQLRSSVNERLRAEQSLQDLNHDLERRVIVRTTELQALAREREAFSYSIAHDLRSPLGVISGFAHMVAKDESAISAEGRRKLGVVEENIAHLVELVDDLLSLAQVNRAEIARAPLEMRALALAEIESLRARYPGAEVQLGEMPAAEGDATLLRQAFGNLLDNALKYSSRGQTARVEAGWSGPAQAYYVRDNGVGFDMNHAARMFGPFERLHDAGEFAGTGIGLAIVKRVIERHEGRVWVVSEPGKGATFYFQIGRRPAAAAPRERLAG